MSWIATDNFDSYGNGNLAGSSGGSGWTSNWSTIGTGSWEPQVQDTVVLQGNKSIAMTPDTTSDRGAQRLFSGISSGTVYFLARRTTNSSGRLIIIFGFGGSDIFKIEFEADGNIKGYGATATTIQSYLANTTYTIGVEFDTTTDQFRVSVNGGVFSSWINFMASTSSIEEIIFFSADSTTVTNYFDFISPTAPIATVNSGFFNLM